MNVRSFLANSSTARRAYRTRARIAMRLGAGSPPPTPPVIVNSLPKAGTHLVTAALQSGWGIRNSGLHVDDSMGAAGIETLSTIREGYYGTAHLAFRPRLWQQPEMVKLMLIRDPRDLLVSHADYVARRRTHRLHDQYRILTTRERQEATLRGVPGLLEPLRERLERFAGWLGRDDVLVIRYEELFALLAQEGMVAPFGRSLGPAPATDVAEALEHKTATRHVAAATRWRTDLASELRAPVDDELGDLLELYGYDR